MVQANLIKGSDVVGSVYNEKINNIIFPKNYGPSMLCKDVEVDTNGKIIAGYCLITISEKKSNSHMERTFSSYMKVPDSSNDLNELGKDNKWALREIALTD